MPSERDMPPSPLVALTAQWLEAWQRALIPAPAESSADPFFADLRQLRSRWFGGLSQTMDAYLRSPAFLALMQLGLGAMTGATRTFLSPRIR